jgi:CheY-like chemotaxis protein
MSNLNRSDPKIGDWLAGGGEMAQLIRRKDWSRTPIGRIENWPQSLRTAVSLCLASNSPMISSESSRSRRSRSDVGKGTGLGLAQIYGFAKQSGGTATIDSTLGEGTTVALYLPRAQGEAIDQRSSESAQETTRGRGKTILVVEDQPDVLEVIEMFLDGLDYRILTAPDGVAARKLLEAGEAIDVLLTDLVMPNGVSGLDLAQDARRLRHDLKIAMMSGYVRDPESRAGRMPDIVFLEKPFRQAELANAIAGALSAAEQ